MYIGVAVFEYMTRWTRLMCISKLWLLLSSLLMALPTLAFMLASDDCFIPFELDSNITAPLPDGLDGNALNLITENGWYAIYMWCISVIMLILFNYKTEFNIKTAGGIDKIYAKIQEELEEERLNNPNLGLNNAVDQDARNGGDMRRPKPIRKSTTKGGENGGKRTKSKKVSPAPAQAAIEMTA